MPACYRILYAAVVTAVLATAATAIAKRKASAGTDQVAPAVSLVAPAQGDSLSDPRPVFSGVAGTDHGDSKEVRVLLWEGSMAGERDHVLKTRRNDSSYSVQPRSDLAPGTYAGRARQVDAAGNVGFSVEIPTFDVGTVTAGDDSKTDEPVPEGDTTAPETAIDSGPPKSVPSGSEVTFEFSSNESGSSFQCKLDGWANWQECASPHTYPSLSDGDRTFEVRATDAAGNVDPTAATYSFTIEPGSDPATTSETEASTGTGPPAGTVVKADYVTRACPIDNLWGAVSDAHFMVTSCSDWSDAADPQVDHFSGGGYPLPARDGKVHAGFRRLSLTDGKQSIYDAGVGNSSYRTQLISNSDTRTFYPMQPGHRYVWWISVRFQGQSPLPGDGVSNDSQVWQIKNTGPCAGSDEVGPVAALTESKNTVMLHQRQRDGDVEVEHLPIGKRGAWQMFAFDVYYSNDRSKAAYRLWGDQDGDSELDLVPLTPKMTGRATAAGPSCIGKPSIGAYQPMELPAVTRDYGVNEMTEVPVGAAWE